MLGNARAYLYWLDPVICQVTSLIIKYSVLRSFEVASHWSLGSWERDTAIGMSHDCRFASGVWTGFWDFMKGRIEAYIMTYPFLVERNPCHMCCIRGLNRILGFHNGQDWRLHSDLSLSGGTIPLPHLLHQGSERIIGFQDRQDWYLLNDLSLSGGGSPCHYLSHVGTEFCIILY